MEKTTACRGAGGGGGGGGGGAAAGLGGQGQPPAAKVCGWPGRSPPHTCLNEASTRPSKAVPQETQSWGGWWGDCPPRPRSRWPWAAGGLGSSSEAPLQRDPPGCPLLKPREAPRPLQQALMREQIRSAGPWGPFPSVFRSPRSGDCGGGITAPVGKDTFQGAQLAALRPLVASDAHWGLTAWSQGLVLGPVGTESTAQCRV